MDHGPGKAKMMGLELTPFWNRGDSRMKRSLTLGAAVLACALVAAAQEAPKFGAYLGYTFVHFSPDSTVPSGVTPPVLTPFTFNANGGSLQLEGNINKWLGIVVNGDVIHHGDIGDFARGTAVDFIAGPRVSYWRDRFRVFAEAMAGGVFYNSSALQPLLTTTTPGNNGVVTVAPATVVVTRVNQGQTNFAFMAGGGVDVRVNKHIALRPVEADYFRTNIKNLQDQFDKHQNNFRYSAGINFTFGAR
jgi:opacity protein-like surface antigen